MDLYFGNVCELDIVFNFNKVYGIIDEMLVGGEVCETSKTSIADTLRNYDKEENKA